MIIKWFQTWLRQKQFLTGSATLTKSQKAVEAHLIDIAHEVLAREALEKSEALKGLEKFGWSIFKKQKKKEQIRSKVKHSLQIPITDEASIELVDEITEKITEAAEADPRFGRLFDDSASEK